MSPRDRILGGELVELRTHITESNTVLGQDIPVNLVHEDESIIIVDKPANLVVHPAAGHADGTLQNALLHHCPALSGIPRCGIVHRIDKDTSGLLAVAKTLVAHKSLVDQLQDRSVKREYLALAQGLLTGGGTVDAPLGRHVTDRKRFAVRQGGKYAVTHYRIEERLTAHTLLRVKLETGRTHQIRVHMAHINHPLVGDPVYGGRLRLPAGASEQQIEAIQGFRRQALHAEILGIMHPETGEYCEWTSPLPTDFSELLNVLRTDN